MNNIRIDPKEFQKSITKELDTIKNRVRNLIGSSHWGEEGRYNNTVPVLFSEGDFVITTYKNVKGIVEVKTKIKNNQLQEIIQKAETNGKLIRKNIFNGIFSYEYEDNINSENMDQAIKRAKGYVNHI